MERTTPNSTRAFLIAPCGINCRVCRAYGRAKNPCPGCRADDADKPKTRVICPIKTCDKIAKGQIKYCFDCDEFPCAPLLHLDKRYRTRYGTSVIDNLQSIKKIGIRRFVKSEDEKWTCSECGGMLCMHEAQCLSCGYA